MYQVSALIFLTVLTWAIAIWATNEESEAPRDARKPEESSDEQDRRKAA